MHLTRFARASILYLLSQFLRSFFIIMIFYNAFVGYNVTFVTFHLGCSWLILIQEFFFTIVLQERMLFFFKPIFFNRSV